MAQGVVKWFNDVKGFGFISRTDGEDIFVHQSAVARGYRILKQGQPVSFDERKGKKGLQAINVRFLSERPTSLKGHSKSLQLSPLPVCVGKKTLLMIAVQSKNLREVTTLLAANVNPNEQDERGTTALMFAASEGSQHIIKVLLDAGANPNIESYKGDDALSIAYDRKKEHCVPLLKQAARLHKRYSFDSVELPQHDSAAVLQDSTRGEVVDDCNAGRWESSEGFGHSFRENGQFGSFPLHEDYSDEGQADGPRDNEWYDRE